MEIKFVKISREPQRLKPYGFRRDDARLKACSSTVLAVSEEGGASARSEGGGLGRKEGATGWGD